MCFPCFYFNRPGVTERRGEYYVSDDKEVASSPNAMTPRFRRKLVHQNRVAASKPATIATVTKLNATQKKRVTKRKRTGKTDPLTAEANGEPKAMKKQIFTREQLIDDILGPEMREKSDKLLEEMNLSREIVPTLPTEELRSIRRVAYRRYCSSRKCQLAKKNGA